MKKTTGSAVYLLNMASPPDRCQRNDQLNRPREGLSSALRKKSRCSDLYSAAVRVCTHKDGKVRTAAPATGREPSETGMHTMRPSPRIENVSTKQLVRTFR